MLYTVVPLEQIYANPMKNGNKNAKEVLSTEKEIEYKDVMLQHGRLITRRDGDKYVIENIISTNMKDYLNEQYAPGKDYNHVNEIN